MFIYRDKNRLPIAIFTFDVCYSLSLSSLNQFNVKLAIKSLCIQWLLLLYLFLLLCRWCFDNTAWLALKFGVPWQEINGKTTIKSEGTKKELPALEVFAKSIKCLCMKLHEDLNRKCDIVKPEDVYYVLTVPAIWNDNAKQFMRTAATMVWLGKPKLMISKVV